MMDPNGYNPLDVSTWQGSSWITSGQRLPASSPVNPQETSTTLFVGDLAVLCDEVKLFDLFYPFGEIESVQLKKSDRDPLRSHLGFGFVKFNNHENAERALHSLNGYFLLGRAMRVGWAKEYGKQQSQCTIEKTIDLKKQRQTVPIHVAFNSQDLTKRVSEIDLGKVFERFGNLLDIAIKRIVVNEVLQTQFGYAFVHFILNNEGIQSAVTAVEEVNNCVIDDIVYQVKITYGLQARILDMTNRIAISQLTNGEFGNYSKRVFDQPTVPFPVQRFNRNFPPQKLVHTFPNATPPMNFPIRSIDKQMNRPFDVFTNRETMRSESFQGGDLSFQTYRSGTLIRPTQSEPVRENRNFYQRGFMSNKPPESSYPSYDLHKSSSDKF